jgi:hypothetical protein
MRMPALLTIIQSLLLAQVTIADRQFPTDVQVDLVFPRNETYAPTQYFPVVLAVKNLDAVWPLHVSLEVRISADSYEKEDGTTGPSWKNVWTGLNVDKFAPAFDAAPNTHFLYIPGFNMTNGTTDHFGVAWELSIHHLCYANDTGLRPSYGQRNWQSRPQHVTLSTVEFSTAPGAQLPDIEAAANSCSKRDKETSAAVRITDVMKTYDNGWPCPILEEIAPSPCAHKDIASLIASNVSDTMLGMMRCEEGDWRTISAPCPKKSAASSSAGFGLGGLLALAFAYWHIL